MSTTLAEEFHRERANTSISHLDAYASSARMNARLDEATAETHEAWRVSAHAMLHPHVQFTGTGKDVPLFVRVPLLYGLRDAGAYALDTDTTDSTDSTYAAHTANAPGGMGGMGVGVGGVDGSGTTRTTRTIRAGSVGYSISARPLYHTHAHAIPVPSPSHSPVRKATLVAIHVPAIMPSILAVLAGATAVPPLEADLDVAVGGLVGPFIPQ